MDLRSHPETRALVESPSPPKAKEYKKREDLLDAAICAWTGALWHDAGTTRCQVLGLDGQKLSERAAATIIAPARASQRATN
jgi:predicted RNase H-like nuclease